MRLQKVVAGAGHGQLEKVEAGASTATLGNGERVQQAGRLQMICHDVLTRRAGAVVLLNRRRQAGPPHQAARQGKRLVTARVPAQRSDVQLVQHLCLKSA